MICTLSPQEVLQRLRDIHSKEFSCLIKINYDQPIGILNSWNDPAKRLPLISAIQSSPSWSPSLNSIICPSIPPTLPPASNILQNNKITYWVDNNIVNNSPHFLAGLNALGSFASEIFDIHPRFFEPKTQKAVRYLLFIGPAGSRTVAHYDGIFFFFLLLFPFVCVYFDL